MLILQSSSSSTYPMTLMEGWNAALDFLAVHPPKMRLSWGLPGRMTPSFAPNPAAVRRHRVWIRLKVLLACWLLRWGGRGVLWCSCEVRVAACATAPAVCLNGWCVIVPLPLTVIMLDSAR
jgi:hypothetical protein